MALHEFDYSDAAIALRTLARMQTGAERSLALTALWRETKERALFLYPRVCCVCNAALVQASLEDLRTEIDHCERFVSTADTPTPLVSAQLTRLVSLLGFEVADSQPDADIVPNRRGATIVHADSIWDLHVIQADMRSSRFAGTGRGGRELPPIEDAIRRLTALLCAADLLSPAERDGRVYQARFWFGRDELVATGRYVDRCLAADD